MSLVRPSTTRLLRVALLRPLQSSHREHSCSSSLWRHSLSGFDSHKALGASRWRQWDNFFRNAGTQSSSDESSTPKEEQEKSPDANNQSEEMKKLLRDCEVLEAKANDLLDKYRRSLAETENMRNRLTKQIEDAKVFGIQGFCKDLLEVADVLNKAVTGVPQEALSSESQYLKDMYQGLQLTETQLLQVFKRHGLVQENPLNEKFDPNKHEALFQIPAPDKEVNTVLDVQKVGYLLHGRTIRPALVGVSKK